MRIVLSCLLCLLTAAASRADSLPQGSRLVDAGGIRLHVRSLGLEHQGRAIVLLSGPTASWHSDSAWFALLQPLLARQVRVHAIDRAGQAWSEGDGSDGYAGFAHRLTMLLPQLEAEPVTVLAFASSDLSLLHYLAETGEDRHIAAALLVDPDGLSPELVTFYADQAQVFQREGLADYVRAGNYDERALSLQARDREHIMNLLDEESRQVFDANYFEAVMKLRIDHRHILARFNESARYDRDVRSAAALRWPASLPVWSVDTDFEITYIEQEADEAERQSLSEWRDRSSAWMASLPGACRIADPGREHLVVVSDAGRIRDLLLALHTGEPCPVATGDQDAVAATAVTRSRPAALAW